jgi:hypothetical protein
LTGPTGAAMSTPMISPLRISWVLVAKASAGNTVNGSCHKVGSKINQSIAGIGNPEIVPFA